MGECEFLAGCGFFNEHAKRHPDLCRGLIDEYCRGDKQDLCKRKHHMLKYENDPPDNMLPGGSVIRLDAQIFCRDSES